MDSEGQIAMVMSARGPCNLILFFDGSQQSSKVHALKKVSAVKSSKVLKRYAYKVRKISECLFCLSDFKKSDDLFNGKSCGGRRAELNSLAGRMWPAGRRLPTPATDD